MNHHTIRLDELYKTMYDATGNAKLFNSVLSQFRSNHDDPDVENYLKDTALLNMNLSKSITYLAIDDNGLILGYYTIALSYIPIYANDNISTTLKKKIRSAKMNNGSETEIAVSYLIGQLARSDKSQKGFGKILLDEAVDKIREISLNIGCNIIRIDCKNNQKILGYYKDNGFTYIKKIHNNELNVLIRVLKRQQML